MPAPLKKFHIYIYSGPPTCLPCWKIEHVLQCLFNVSVIFNSSSAWMYGAHRTCAETAAVSRGTSHLTTKQRYSMHIPFRWIFRNALSKAAVTHSEYIRLERSGSARNQRIGLFSRHCEALRAHVEMRRSSSRCSRNHNNRVWFFRWVFCTINKLKQNEAQSARVQSAHKGVN